MVNTNDTAYSAKSNVMTPEYIIQRAGLYDHAMIQNLARFMVYEISRYSLKDFKGWRCDDTGLYHCYDLTSFFTEQDCQAFKVLVEDELAGFVLINQFSHTKKANWSIAEFFIAAKFQRLGLGKKVAFDIFNRLNGVIELSSFADNTPAVTFWQNILKEYTTARYDEILLEFRQPVRHQKFIWTFINP